MVKNMNPRKPTQTEKKLLAEYILRDEDLELYDAGKIDPERKAEVEEAIEAAAIVIFDHYIIDSVGYAGKIMVVVWPSAPENTQTFTWSRDNAREYLAEEKISP
jgi:hypothetical protein